MRFQCPHPARGKSLCRGSPSNPRGRTETLVQTRKIEPLPIILVGRSFWSRAVDFAFLVEEGVIDPEDRDLFCFAETSDEIVRIIANWYAQAGDPLIDVTAKE
jgi:predicted Rossmann-fold nucleotide-binding protein